MFFDRSISLASSPPNAKHLHAIMLKNLGIWRDVLNEKLRPNGLYHTC